MADIIYHRQLIEWSLNFSKPGSRKGYPDPDALTNNDKVVVGVLAAVSGIVLLALIFFGPYCFCRKILERKAVLEAFDEKEMRADMNIRAIIARGPLPPPVAQPAVIPKTQL